jgi:hypothetical protein
MNHNGTLSYNLKFISSFQTSDLLALPPVSNSDVCKAVKRLRRSKSVGLDNIRTFVIKGCSDIL